MTSGGLAKLPPRQRRLLLAGFVSMSAVRAAVNAGSVADEHALAGRELAACEAWA